MVFESRILLLGRQLFEAHGAFKIFVQHFHESPSAAFVRLFPLRNLTAPGSVVDGSRGWRGISGR
jgi:hypothetical protein